MREQFDYICESARTNEHQREMSFLRHLMLYDDTPERHELERKINKAERHERCSRRAMWLMVVLTAFALAGLGYSVILLDDFFQNKFQLVIRLFCALGLASVVSLIVFMGFWIVSRAVLDEQREGCRRLVTRIVESRLGKLTNISSPQLAARPAARDAMKNCKQQRTQHDIKA